MTRGGRLRRSIRLGLREMLRRLYPLQAIDYNAWGKEVRLAC